MTSLIQVLDHGPIRQLRLARATANALDTALCTELAAAIAQAQADAVSALVLSGSERIFSAGMDVPDLLGHGSDRAKLLGSWKAFFAAARALANSAIPVVAALTGHAPAGGCVLALCCDYRVMARSPEPAHPVTIGLNETQVGLAAPEGIQRLLRRVVGAHRAERLLVGGELVSAERALQIGLVDELVDAEQVVARALAWLQDLSRLPRQPMLQTRAIARADLRAALADEHIQLERLVDGWQAPDTQAALHALVARLGKR
ncbi:enoyl-CoA hydratase/isomerase family protein [Xanthomonas translucens]|uniref:enoyl-CoA hydratase/isomerase family protein n=1 Tax=Xanthomonas campestris pv. translucens TaxID=343 RepID=UPI0002A7B8CC|nr:enoyl-CoA hydratase/isomerase family protein [Xanthomonas translucens]AVY67645.1 enoyl-CoA hydratase [Xanthomonas translucens pv. undulosa]ELQ09416.1 enoyl-CoA hydratase/isomerase [Xanthomonas translucens DAR61454]MBC3973595.1 enoyl-CoA hydratase/isomerase family protein [Xanthomonas translucens pv. undulosa]MCT8281276.1 enoyl-CoA hydratase/isomerase family protein [Xanthomonas translucens pv. undulosa]MCT8316187.1 enoyl-CoA hydratase/isomerase family protein [Xanthomonas translucens pv. un